MSPRALLFVNVVVRLVYGVAGTASPRALAAARFAIQRSELDRPAARLALAIDAVDVATAIAEAVARRRIDLDTAAAALRDPGVSAERSP